MQKGKHENTNPLEKLHDGEPYFFIRAQDKHAPDAVRSYADILHDAGDIKGRQGCNNFANCMEEWQHHNPDKVKSPD